MISLLGQSQSKYDHPFLKRKPGFMRYYTGFSAPTEKTPDKFDRFNTDFFWNSWLGDQNGVATKFYAIGHSINLMFDIPFSKKSISQRTSLLAHTKIQELLKLLEKRPMPDPKARLSSMILTGMSRPTMPQHPLLHRPSLTVMRC